MVFLAMWIQAINVFFHSNSNKSKRTKWSTRALKWHRKLKAKWFTERKKSQNKRQIHAQEEWGSGKKTNQIIRLIEVLLGFHSEVVNYSVFLWLHNCKKNSQCEQWRSHFRPKLNLKSHLELRKTNGNNT